MIKNILFTIVFPIVIVIVVIKMFRSLLPKTSRELGKTIKYVDGMYKAPRKIVVK